MKPEVSVVIPTRDRWELLSTHSLPSALAQEGVRLEVVVVDDGSQDGTTRRIRELRDDRVRGLRLDVSRGAAAARNAGIADARGDWVAFLDDDDLWSPQKIRAQLDSIGPAEWGYTGAFIVDERLEPTHAFPVPDPDTLTERFRGGNALSAGSSTVIARTELLWRVGGLDETLMFGYDWDLWRRLAAIATPTVCPEPLVATVEHARRSRMEGLRVLVRETDELVRRSGGDRTARRAAVEWLANDQSRGGRRLAAAALYFRAAVLFRSPGNVPAAVGALFGDRGLRAASRLLKATRGVSHLDLERSPPADSPDWLVRFRSSVVHAGATA